MKLPIAKSVYDSLLEQMDILDISCATIRQSGAIAKALEAQIEKMKAQILELWEELPPTFVSSSETGLGRDEILDYIGIDESRLPEVLPIGAEVGNLTPAAAEALGLSTEVKVYNGAHDQYCASIGRNSALFSAKSLASTGSTLPRRIGRSFRISA